MANVTVYNRVTGRQYQISLNVFNNLEAGTHIGTPSWYIQASTSQRTAHNEPVEPVLVLDITSPTLTEDINNAVTEIMERVEGALNSSSSSSSSRNSSSSSSSSKNSSSSSSSSSSST